MDLSTREHCAGPQDQRRTNWNRLPEAALGLPSFPRQHRKLPIVMADAGIASGPGRIALHGHYCGGNNLEFSTASRFIHQSRKNGRQEKMTTPFLRADGGSMEKASVLDLKNKILESLAERQTAVETQVLTIPRVESRLA